MKKIFLFVTLFIMTFHSFSQDRKGFIGIGLGSAIPTGAFAASSGSYNTAGYASTGLSFNLNFQYKLNDWFGLCLTSFDAANSMNADKLIASTITGSSITTTVDKVSSASCFLIGGYVKKHDFPLYGKIQIGYGSVKTAAITLSDNTGSASILQSDATYGFAYSIGTGGFFTLSNRWALTLALDYVSCLAKPNVIAFDHTSLTQSVSPTFDYGQNFICFQVGIGYMFK